MLPDAARALDDIRAHFEEPIIVSSASGGAPVIIPAVFSSQRGEEFMGPGQSVRHSWFQIAMADWPFGQPPRRRDSIVYGSGTWSVIDVTPREDVEAWDVSVERSA